MPTMPRPSKDARDIAYNILGTPTPLMEQETKKKAKKEIIDVDYENSDIDVLKGK